MEDRKHPVPAVAGVRVDGGNEISRGDALLRGALAVGAFYGLSAVGPYVRRALAADDGGDVDVLNYLLPFEYLQVSLYNRGRTEINDHGEKMPLQTREKKLLNLLFTQEGQHVAAVKEMIEELGGKPVEKRTYAFAFRVFEQFLEIADTMESTAIEAYNGAIPSLESAEARELADSIVQVEARHAATVRIGNRQEPAPETFELGASEEVAISHVLPFTGVFPGEE
jgi:rubrerythrin